MPRAASRCHRDQLVAGLEALQTSAPDAGECAANTPFQPFTASAGDRAADRSSMRESRRAPPRRLSPTAVDRLQAASAKVSPPSISLMTAVNRKAWSLLPMAGSPAGIKGYMDIAYLSTLSALAGSVVGGLTSGVATWLSQRAQARESQLAREMARRDDLYKEFIAAASKAYGEAIVSNEPNVQEFVALYAMISRMRLQSAAANSRVRREGHARNNRHLLCTWQDDSRIA